jgi:hypothetical protein
MKLAPRLQVEPTKHGTHGKAWRINLDVWRTRYGKTGGEICGWIIEAPWAHPMWHSYMLSAVHLRPLDGLEPAVIYLPGATHEVMLYALNPEHTPALDQFPKLLMPANFHGQWIEVSDEAACLKVEGCVDAVIAGQLSPDTDFTREWIRRFSDSNIKQEWRGLEGTTGIGVMKDGAVAIIGSGKTAAELITGIATANEPVPPKSEQH